MGTMLLSTLAIGAIFGLLCLAQELRGLSSVRSLRDTPTFGHHFAMEKAKSLRSITLCGAEIESHKILDLADIDELSELTLIDCNISKELERRMEDSLPSVSVLVQTSVLHWPVEP
jgi:hypothetical protein